MVNRSPSTAAGIVFFDDEKGLQRCLSSIQSFVDLIIAIDGNFRYFEDDHDLSIDNSRKVVESFPNATYHCYPNLTEIDKRNKYLEIAGTKGIDFLLVIDSDEYAVIDINEFSKNLAKIKENKTGIPVNDKIKDTPDVYGIKIFEKHFEKPDFIRERYIERIFYKPAKLRYHLIHVIWLMSMIHLEILHQENIHPKSMALLYIMMMIFGVIIIYRGVYNIRVTFFRTR